MCKLIRKLKSVCGESFVEILIAIMIVAFGCMLVATMYGSSLKLNSQAAKQDEAFYAALSETEQMLEGESSGQTGRVDIVEDDGGSMSVTVDLYGDETNAAYKRH